MKFSLAKDESMFGIKTKIVNQSQLTSACWLIQVWGIKYCKTCEFKGKEDCGGRTIIKKIREGTFPRGGLGKEISNG